MDFSTGETKVIVFILIFFLRVKKKPLPTETRYPPTRRLICFQKTQKTYTKKESAQELFHVDWSVTITLSRQVGNLIDNVCRTSARLPIKAKPAIISGFKKQLVPRTALPIISASENLVKRITSCFIAT